jgi:hypothetical protein
VIFSCASRRGYNNPSVALSIHMVAEAARHWKTFCKEHPDVGHPATGGVVVDDDTIILHRDGPETIVAVYRIVGAGKLKLLAW